MEQELKRQLEEIHALVKDNHHMLRTIRRHQVASLVGRIVVLVVALIVPLYLYQQFIGTSGMPTSTDLQKLIDSYKVSPN